MLRELSITLTVAFLTGCAVTGGQGPREYLDEQTAATITVAAEPVVLVQHANPQDFIHLYAVDVNRMGEHRQYLALLHWWGEQASVKQPELELSTADGAIKLRSTPASARELGIADHIDKSAPASGVWWYFPIDAVTLATLKRSRVERALLRSAQTQERRYVVWRDGRDHLVEWASAVE